MAANMLLASRSIRSRRFFMAASGACHDLNDQPTGGRGCVDVSGQRPEGRTGPACSPRPRAFGGRRIHFVVILDLWPDRTRSRRSRSMDHLPDQPVAPVAGVPAPTAVAQRRRCRAGQSGRIIRFAHHFTHHWGTAIRTGPGAPGPPAAPGCQNPPAHPARNPPDDPWAPAARIIENSLVYMVNATVRTGKPAVCRGDADPAQPIHRVSPDALTSLISGSVGGSGFSGSAAGGSR